MGVGLSDVGLADSYAFLRGGKARIMGSGSLRELLIPEKIGYGVVYVTDPVVPTKSGPKLAVCIQECAAVDSRHKKRQSYKRHMQIAGLSC